MRAGNIAESFTAIVRGEVRAPLGTMAMSAASIVKLGLQAAVIPVLARLLWPQAFGLVALAMPLIFLSAALGDGGLGQALVRHDAEGVDVAAAGGLLAHHLLRREVGRGAEQAAGVREAGGGRRHRNLGAGVGQVGALIGGEHV